MIFTGYKTFKGFEVLGVFLKVAGYVEMEYTDKTREGSIHTLIYSLESNDLRYLLWLLFSFLTACFIY